MKKVYIVKIFEEFSYKIAGTFDNRRAADSCATRVQYEGEAVNVEIHNIYSTIKDWNKTEDME